ncbi:MAG: hypothetical protein JNK82_03780 [Myxococcaceae bacterium]|nr:hypothetical protein [Myxococcaceae bacterium]
MEPWPSRAGSWCSELPPDAGVVQRERREKSRKARPPTVEYDDWCSYKTTSVLRRIFTKKTGPLGEAPSWPPPPECPKCLSFEKEVSYDVELRTDDGMTLTCSWSDPTRWQALTAGHTYRLEVTRLGDTPKCETLK